MTTPNEQSQSCVGQIQIRLKPKTLVTFLQIYKYLRCLSFYITGSFFVWNGGFSQGGRIFIGRPRGNPSKSFLLLLLPGFQPGVLLCNRKGFQSHTTCILDLLVVVLHAQLHMFNILVDRHCYISPHGPLQTQKFNAYCLVCLFSS